MGLFNELKRLTQPYGDEDDFYEGADSTFQPQQVAQVSDAQQKFENTFADNSAPAPEPAPSKGIKTSSPAGSIFGNLVSSSQTAARQTRSSRAARKNAVSADQSVIRFNPRDFDEAGELITYLEQGRSLIMSLEDIPSETARRLLDFMSGIAFAVNGKITPVSAKTYFVTPENVDLLDAQPGKAGNDEDQDF